MADHGDPHRAAQNRPRYARVDGRPFPPLRLRERKSAKPNKPPYRSDIINALKNFDFCNVADKSVTELTKLFSKYHKQHHREIQLGQFGMVDYGFAPQTLAPGSLNSVNASAPRDGSPRSLLKNLHFVNAKDRDVGAPRLALVLGRLKSNYFTHGSVCQSHWIIFLDQTRILWACYAHGIDDEDALLGKGGNPIPYYASCDTAFGAKKDEGQKVVFLGALKDIPFNEKEELKAEVHDLDWSTSALSEDQILEMKKQDLLLATPKPEEEGKDEDAAEDSKMNDTGSKETKGKKCWDAKKDAKERKYDAGEDGETKDNGVKDFNEEQLYGTREPADPKHSAKKDNLSQEDNSKQESLETESSLAEDVDIEDVQLPDAESTPGNGSAED